MTNAEGAIERTRTLILDAAARVLGRRPDAPMVDIADAAGIHRATLYRHFPTRESLLRGVADAGTTELTDALTASNLDELSVERAITRIAGVFLRTGAKYAALISHVEEYNDPAEKERVIQPVRDVITRGMRTAVLRADLSGETLFEMFTALIERALWLISVEALTPEAAAEAVVTMFLDGAREAD